MSDEIKRKLEHLQRAHEIMELPYQDAVAIIGELIAEEDEWQEAMCREWSKGYQVGRNETK